MSLKYWCGVPYCDDGYCDTVEEVEIHDNFWFKVVAGIFITLAIIPVIMILIR